MTMARERVNCESLGTVQRVVEVIRYLADHSETTLKEVSVATGLAPSTCHRLLDLLARDGLVARDCARRGYRVGPELLRISAQIQSKQNICSIALPFLRRVVAGCDESCLLGLYLPNDSKLYFAEKAESTRLLRYQVPMNTPLSVLWGASGLAILAYLDEREVERIYAQEKRAPASGEELPARATLDREITLLRRRGYGVTYGQKICGAVGVAAPVFRADGQVIGSLTVTIPQARMRRPDEGRIGELVRSAASELSSTLGAPSRVPARATA
jgi:DNA-binding IclR family transcriptional regulator